MDFVVNQRLPSIHTLLDLPKQEPQHQKVVLPSITHLNLPHVNANSHSTATNTSSQTFSPSSSVSPTFPASGFASRSQSTGSTDSVLLQPTPSYLHTRTPPAAHSHRDHSFSPQNSTFSPQTPTSQPHSGTSSPTSNEEAANEETAAAEPKKWKPRKKRQCPECKLFFSNLATHKSTHLNSTSRPHVCEYCSRGFARPNDLFRHIKCHWKEIGSDKGQFKCPYKNHTSGDHCGHNSGIFSRCDTFKNHLKAIHFQYPNGTKKDQRAKTGGNCRMCQKHFESVDDWLTNHLEKNQCAYANEYKKKF